MARALPQKGRRSRYSQALVALPKDAGHVLTQAPDACSHTSKLKMAQTPELWKISELGGIWRNIHPFRHAWTVP